MPPSLGSPEALYHVIPNQDDIVNASQIELEAGSEADVAAYSPPDPPIHFVDSQIRWIHFILGCSVLLSWNGALRHIVFSRQA
jgi:equilibrative nucleoside transporter 1/2/3